MPLSDNQIERYSRQIILPGFGESGQKKLLDARVLIVGCGGLGSPCAYYLTAAGVGTLGLVDSDSIELHNLNRQILHTTPNIGINKTISAKEKLLALNPDVHIETYPLRLTPDNALEIIKSYDLVIDATDNFPVRYLLNDACVLSNKPLSHAGVLQYDGQITTIIPFKGGCYRCLFPEPPNPMEVGSCTDSGILGTLPGVLGCLQATEVIKYLVGIGESLAGYLLIFNALSLSFRKIKIPHNKNCIVCGEQPTLKTFINYDNFCSFPNTPE